MGTAVVLLFWIGQVVACSNAAVPSATPTGSIVEVSGEMQKFKRPELSNVLDGLDAARRAQKPVFDRFQLDRDREYIEGSRLYSDGTRYVIRKHVWDTSKVPPSWRKQFLFTAAGVEIVKAVLQPLHGVHSHSHSERTSVSTGAGSSTWVSYREDSELVFKTGEVDFACSGNIRNAIGEALTQNVAPRQKP